MSRNYGLGSRDMSKAGQFALNNAAREGAMSFSSAATIADRWSQFCEFAKSEGVNKMENIDRDLVIAYAQTLTDLSPATAQNYISAINTVMSLATHGEWESVSPTRDCGLENRSTTRVDPVPDRDQVVSAIATVTDERLQAVASLMHELGLRSKEASLLDARAAYAEASARGAVTIERGTKGGREREIPITRPEQLAALSRAAEIQGHDRSMIPAEKTWAEWRQSELRDLRESLQAHGIDRLHDLRASYAVERFETLTGHAAPINGGHVDPGDREAMQQLAEELGHGRIEVLSEYIGR